MEPALDEGLEPTDSGRTTACASPPLLALAPDIAVTLYAFLPVADLLSFSAACRTAQNHAAEQQHWRDLMHRYAPATPVAAGSPSSLSSSCGGRKWDGKEGPEDEDTPPQDYRATFVSKAEAELQWRRGRPVAVRERRLAMGETGIAQQRLQSMALWRRGGLLLVAVGEELGLFADGGSDDDDEGGGDDGDDDGRATGPTATATAAAEASLRHPIARLVAHEGSKVTVVKAAPFGIVTAGMDGRVKVLAWESLTGVREELDHHNSAVWGLDAELAGTGAPTIAASCFRRITVSDLRQPPHHHPAISFQGHATWVRTLHLEMDRHLLVSGSADASCKTWDLRSPGQMQSKLVHPNHFEEVRSVQCRGDRVYTGCYDGIVREFDLPTGRFRRAIADHGPYAVEAAQVGPDRNGRVVSVDWSGVVGCVPATESGHGAEQEGLAAAEDVESLVYGRCGALATRGWGGEAESDFGRHGGVGNVGSNRRCISIDTGRVGTYHLCPARDPSTGRLQYRRREPREEPPEVPEALLSPKVGCLVQDEDRLLLGTTDGRIVSMLFRGGRRC